MYSNLNKYFDNKFSFNKAQIVFCVDTTGSMQPFIDQVKETIKRLVTELKKANILQSEYCFVGYRDHEPQDRTYITKIYNDGEFTDARTIVEYIEKEVRAGGGGDVPEAVLDGLFDCATKVKWNKKSMKFVFHIADAPPHGTHFHEGFKDGFPEGCPHGHTEKSVGTQFIQNNIRYVLLNCAKNENTLCDMISRFGSSRAFKNFPTYRLEKNDGLRMLTVVTKEISKTFKEEFYLISEKIRADMQN
jgi:hypothetical protein